MNVINEGNSWIINDETVAASFQSYEDPRTLSDERSKQESFDWDSSAYHAEDFAIFPYGDMNDLPKSIRDVIHSNYLMPGLLSKKRNLLWGQGPVLYEQKIIDNQLVRELVHDSEIQSWLDDFDYKDEILKCITDFSPMQGVACYMNRAKGVRLGRGGFIASVEHEAIEDVRLGAKIGSRNHAKKKPTHAIIQTSFGAGSYIVPNHLDVYPLFDNSRPFDYPTSMVYSNLYSFGIDVYTLPDIFGALEWMRISSQTPLILKAFINDSINLKFHIESPQKYWDNVEAKLKKICEENQEIYSDKMLQEYKSKLFKNITNVLSGAYKAGKMLHTITILDTDGNNVKEMGWKINVIDQKTKDFVESQIKISNRADYAVSASASINASLGNISENGKVDSGSEKLYAYQEHIKSNVPIPEYITLKPFNMAIRHNFPKKNIRLGFLHESMIRTEDVTKSERFTETTTA